MNNKPNKTTLSLVLILFSLILLESCNSNSAVGDYTGTPFEDKVYQKGAQKVPGKLQCEYYDNGGEGVAFHDSDSIN